MPAQTHRGLEKAQRIRRMKVARAVQNKPYVTTTQGMSGWFAVHVWWNPEGFWEPYDTGFGRYATEAGAVDEAKIWAKQLELEYKPRVAKT